MHEIPDFPEASEPAIQPKRNFGLLLIRASFLDKTYMFLVESYSLGELRKENFSIIILR